jgi:hypothetical protein
MRSCSRPGMTRARHVECRSARQSSLSVSDLIEVTSTIAKIVAMVRLYLIVASLVVGLTSHSADACSIYTAPDVRIARINAKTVVLVTVVQASYTGERTPDYRPWKGVAQLKRVLRGATSTRRFSIRRSGSTAACDDGISPPAVGETWILYLGQRDGSEVVLLSYPAAVARSADPDLFSRRGGS